MNSLSITYVSWNHIYGWLKTTRDRLHKRLIKSLFRYYLDQGIKSQIRIRWILWCCGEGNCRVGSSLWFCYQTPTWHTQSNQHGRGIKTTLKTSGHREKRKGHTWSSESSGCSEDLPPGWTSSVWGENIGFVVMDLPSVLIWPLQVLWLWAF